MTLAKYLAFDRQPRLFYSKQQVQKNQESTYAPKISIPITSTTQLSKKRRNSIARQSVNSEVAIIGYPVITRPHNPRSPMNRTNNSTFNS